MGGRQFKEGLDYFPLDINFFDNKKMQLIEAEFGLRGIIVAVRLLCRIYANGYFYQWGGDECLLFTKAAGAEFVPKAVSEIVNGLVRRRFFDKGCFDSFGILTSQSIQKIYLEASGRRKSIEIISEYWLLPYPDTKNVNIISINADINEQRKEKVKENKITLSVAVNTRSVRKIPEHPENDVDDHLPYEHLISIFNAHTTGIFGTLRMPLHVTRKKQIMACIRAFGIDSFEEMARAVARSSFLQGENQRGFRATFDWMIRPANYQKIIEGNFEHNKKDEYETNRGHYRSVAERVRSESDTLKEQLAAKYGKG